VPSRGWEVEEIVTRQACEDLERLAMQARARVLSGESSVARYHSVIARAWTSSCCPQTTGLWRWRVRRPSQAGGVRAFCRLRLSWSPHFFANQVLYTSHPQC